MIPDLRTLINVLKLYYGVLLHERHILWAKRLFFQKKPTVKILNSRLLSKN